MSSSSGTPCHCHFCAPPGLSLSAPSLDITRKWQVWFLIVLLLARGGYSGPAKRRAAGSALSVDKNADSATMYSQKMQININTSLGPQCSKDEDCFCYSIGKCKRCSRLDISRQLGECMVTGYKQRAYCPNIKKKRFISCHFVENPQEARLFWLFEGSAFAIGVVAYSIALLRLKKIERTVARRIQQQINA